MATGQPTWLYIIRGSCAIFIIIVNLVLPRMSYTTPAVRPSKLLYFYILLGILFLLSLGDFAAFLVESMRQNKLPNTITAYCEASLSMSIAVEFEWFLSQEKEPVWYAHAISWALLCIFEILNIIYLCLQPTTSLYFAITEGLVCIALLLLLLYQGYLKGYKRLSSSHPENVTEAYPTEREHDIDDEDSTEDKANNNDVLGIRREALEEVRELGGWWPFLKRFRIFLKYTWPWGQPLLQLRAILAIIIVFAESILDYLDPIQNSNFYNKLATGAEDWHPFLKLVLIRTLNSSNFLVIVRELLWIGVSLHRSARLRTDIHAHIMKLDHLIHDLISPVDFLKAADYAGAVDKLFDTFFFDLIPHLTRLILSFVGLLHRYGPFMMLILTYMTVFYLLLEKRSVTVLIKERDKYIKVNDTQERRRQDGVRGWATVSNHNQVKYEINCFKSEVKIRQQQLRRYYLLAYSFEYLQAWTLWIGQNAATIFILCEIYAGRLGIGDLIAFSGLWKLLLKSVQYFSSVVNDKLEDILDATRLRRIMESNPGLQKGNKDLENIKGDVEFHNVTFSYPKTDNKILDHMSVKIEWGSTVAIVGSTGVGKTTLIKLIKRHYKASDGIISIDGQDIATLESESLHKLVGMMSQKPYFFNKTVMENIKYANQGATNKEVYDASRKAGLHESIVKRDGKYQSMMKENGENFSGGELQRLALARLFLQKPKIVLIDEGTSALDVETEDFIKEKIEEEFADNTVIIIAHRLSSIMHADRILVLGKGGKILEDGKHADLVNRNGGYARLWGMHIGEGPLI